MASFLHSSRVCHGSDLKLQAKHKIPVLLSPLYSYIKERHSNCGSVGQYKCIKRKPQVSTGYIIKSGYPFPIFSCSQTQRNGQVKHFLRKAHLG